MSRQHAREYGNLMLERFDFWSVPRAVFLVATFWAMLLATAAFRRSRPRAD